MILERPDEYYQAPAYEAGKSVAIVGAGPSGLSAAYYLRRAGLRTTVFDAKAEAGGMLMYAIPAYRLPKAVVRAFVSALEKMGVEFRPGQKIGVDISPQTLERQYDSVLYATGAWKRPVVGISGEELTIFGLDFLAEVRKWMSGMPVSSVVVAGGGNVAMDVAVTAKRLGVDKVTLVCLEPLGQMPASEEEIARAEEEGVEIMPGWGLSKVREEGGAVKGIQLKRCVSLLNANGEFAPSYDENMTMDVETGNILMAVGQAVDLSYFGEDIGMRLTGRGFIEVEDETGMTSKAGIFASGDVTTGPSRVVGAVAGGRKAAEGIIRHLGVAVREDEMSEECGFIHFDAEGTLKTEALKLRALDRSMRSLEREDSYSPTMDEAVDEASRCRNCGCYCSFPSDTATALVALDAEVVTNRRAISLEQLYDSRSTGGTALALDEIILEIRTPMPQEGSRSAFMKMAWRKAIDFPVVNCAVRTGVEARVCLGAVAPKPYRARGAEGLIAGHEIDDNTAEEAGRLAVLDAIPFEAAKYKMQIAKTLVKRALLSVSQCQ